jgi:hypothetical protein
MNGLIIPTKTTELELRINTANVGKDETGINISGLVIASVVLSDAEGVDSGKSTVDADETANSKTTDIVSAIVTPAVTNEFGGNDKTAEIRLVVDGGLNSTADGDAVQAELTALTLEVDGGTLAGQTVSIRNSNGDTVGTGSGYTTETTVTIPVASDPIGNDNEVYQIIITGGEAIFRLAKEGVTYSINGAGSVTTKLENTLDLGEYSDID